MYLIFAIFSLQKKKNRNSKMDFFTAKDHLYTSEALFDIASIDILARISFKMLAEVTNDIQANVTANLAASGDYVRLKYAKEILHFDWDCVTPAYAAKTGHLDCLVYAHEHGCEWDWITPAFAAKNGHLDCLVYAHEHGCEWDDSVIKCAAKNGHSHCLAYAIANKVPGYEKYIKIQ